MALTAITTFDLVGQTQTITFSDPSVVDTITYSSNQITFENISSYNLVKSDLLLYVQYVTVFNTLIIKNFPVVNLSISLEWSPLSIFNITESFAGVEHITYTQSSNGTQVTSINYVPTATAASIAARSSPVTIPLQEWFMFINMMQQYGNQVSFN